MTQLELTDIDTGDEDTASVNSIVIAHAATRRELGSAVRSCLESARQTIGQSWVDETLKMGMEETVAKGSWEYEDTCVNIDGVAIAIGIDPDRTHVRSAVNALDNDVIDADDIVVNSIAALGETHEEIQDRVSAFVAAGATIHLTSACVNIDGDSSDGIIGVLDGLDSAGLELQRETEMRDVRDWCDGFDRSRGRAPLGFTYDDDGELETADNFDEVRAVLSMVLDDSPDGLSKRKAAERLDVSPRTITRAIEGHPNRYGLGQLTDSIE
ncbi:hypothetical protein [Natrinema sp. 74]|uniref:hypothetical protein n=1 Tax=Natrinema sp. 74 TaxID=3384159 RepID=UPI0038D36521